MVKAIQGKVVSDLFSWIEGIKALVVRFASLVISVWIMAGVLVFGIGLPLHLMRSHGKKAIEIQGTQAKLQDQIELKRQENSQLRATSYSGEMLSGAYSSRVSKPKEQPALRTQLRETTNTVSEIRRLARGFGSLASR